MSESLFIFLKKKYFDKEKLQIFIKIAVFNILSFKITYLDFKKIK